MNKLFYWFVLFLFLLSSFSYAALNDAVLYYSFDNDDLSGSNPIDLSGTQSGNGNNTGATTNITGILGQAFDFEATESDIIDIGAGTNLNGNYFNTNGMTVCTWFKPESQGSYNAIFGRDHDSGTTPRAYALLTRVPAGTPYLATQNNGANEILGTNASVPNNSFNHICYTMNSSNYWRIYVNGSQDATSYQGASLPDAPNIASQICARSYTSSRLFCDGVLDEFGVWGRELSQAEITTLFNGGAGYNPYAAAGNNFEVTAIDVTNSGSILNFTVEVNGTNYTTTNGTVTTSVLQSSNAVFDITFYNASNNTQDYFNRTYSSYNVSSNLQGTLYRTPMILDTTWNLTSDGGCTVWTSDKTTACNTTDGTPTITFDTSTNANCSISTTNYASYNSSYICSTTGSTSQVCTLYNAEQLDYGLTNVYVQCQNAVPDNELSGALSVNMTAGGGGGGSGLISCIETVGIGCAAVITNNCAAIIS